MLTAKAVTRQSCDAATAPLNVTPRPKCFSWLSLSLEHEGRLHQTVQAALNAHLQPELLTDKDFQFRCNNPECQSTRLPYKTSNLTVLPKVLCILLKRWRGHGVADALLHDVQCDEQLLCGMLFTSAAV